MAVGPDRLDYDLVRTLVEIFVEPGLNLIRITPDHHRVHQPIAAAVFEVALLEAEPEPVVVVVWQREVEAERRPRRGTSLNGVGTQADLLLADDRTAALAVWMIPFPKVGSLER